MSTITQKSIMKYVIMKKITSSDQRNSPRLNKTIHGLLVVSSPALDLRPGATRWS
jgi:hypothetical protein